MRKSTVRHGLKLILTGILAVTIGTFFHGELADLFLLGPAGDAEIVAFGLFLGGLAGGCGVLVAAGGFLQSGAGESEERLLPLFVAILVAVLFFFYLAYSSFTAPAPPRLRPGESVTI